MPWLNSVVFYLGIFDASMVMIGGSIAAFVILMGWDSAKLWERIFPALGTLIASNIGAGIILGAARWLMT